MLREYGGIISIHPNDYASELFARFKILWGEFEKGLRASQLREGFENVRVYAPRFDSVKHVCFGEYDHSRRAIAEVCEISERANNKDCQDFFQVGFCIAVDSENPLQFNNFPLLLTEGVSMPVYEEGSL